MMIYESCLCQMLTSEEISEKNAMSAFHFLEECFDSFTLLAVGKFWKFISVILCTAKIFSPMIGSQRTEQF